MSSPEQQTPIEIELKPDLLERINNALTKLGSTSKYLKVPKYQEGYEHLLDKTVLMVDDVFGVLEGFIPELMVASNGNADFIHYQGQVLNELVRQIMEKNPDLVFMDYHLSDQLKGSAVTGSLKKQGFAGDIIGFSSDRDTTKDFINSGARACLDKDISDLSGQLQKSPEAFAPLKANS